MPITLNTNKTERNEPIKRNEQEKKRWNKIYSKEEDEEKNWAK